MKHTDLKVGDQVRILGVPNQDVPNYTIFPETVAAFEALVARRRPVRISEIDEDGTPWYNFRLKAADGTWEYHFMSVAEDDNNWRVVKKRG